MEKNMLDVFKSEIEKLCRQSPHRFPKPIYVLPVIHENTDSQWKERLSQARENHTGECMVLIPFNLENYCWTGVLIKFKENGQIQQAALIDPVIDSMSILDKLQKQFAQVYPDVIVQSKTLQRCNDRDHHVSLFVENFVKTIIEDQIFESLSSDTDRLYSSISDNHQSSACLYKTNPLNQQEETNSTAFSASQSKTSERFHLVERLNVASTKLKVSGVSQLPKKIQQIEKQIKDYEEQTEKERKFLIELKLLQGLADEFHFLSPNISVSAIKPFSTILESKGRLDDTVMTHYEHNEDSIIGDRLEKLWDDFSSIPICAERSLLRLISHISFQASNMHTGSNHTAVVSDWIEIDIEKEFESFKTQLRIEELETEGIRNLIEIALLNVKNQNWKNALIVLEKIFRKISPLNLNKLFKLVDKVNDAADLMKGKDVIFFLGETGVGKSTIIHFLAGSKMIETTVEGLTHIMPVDIKNTDLKKISTSPFARSETRFIIPITVNFKDFGGCSTDSILLCDSPGLEDTDGPEVDIANGIGIVKAIKGCKSVRPVLVVSYKSIGDRFGGFKNVANRLLGLIPEIQDHIQTFSYIFTKFPLRERDTIHASLANIKETIDYVEKSNAGYSHIIADMLKKTRTKTRVLDPINDDPLVVFDELIKSHVIKHPNEVFHFSITARSKAAVQEQVRKHQFSIISATKRREYDLLKYKLDQLKHLNDLLVQEYIAQIYHDCVLYISRHLADEYQEGISSLDHCLLDQTILSNEDIKHYQTCIDHAKRADVLRKDHLGKEVVHSSAFIQHLDQQLDMMFTDLKEKNIDDVSVKLYLDKTKLLSQSFTEINANKYRDICKAFDEKLKHIVKSFERSVLSHDFDMSTNDLTKVYQAFNILDGHVDRKDIEAKYTQMREYFIKYLDESIEKLRDMFTREKLDENDIARLNSGVYVLEMAKKTFALHQHISKEALDTVYENLVLKIEHYFQEIVTKLCSKLSSENSFHILEEYMKQLDLIRTISVIERRTTRSYNNTWEKLVAYFYESKRVVEDLLDQLFRKEGKVCHDTLRKSLFNLRQAQWIDQYQTEMYLTVIHDVKELVMHYIQAIKKSTLETNLDLENYDKIESVDEVLLEMNEMRYLEKIVPDITQHLVELRVWFEARIKNVYAIIQDSFSLEKYGEQTYRTIDLSKAEKSFHYLNACKKTRTLCGCEWISVRDCLEGFIKSYSHFVQYEMKHCFQNIKQYQGKNQEYLVENIQIFSNRFEEISEIKNNYPYVFSCFTNQKIIEQWQNELSDDLIELEIEMEKLRVTKQTVGLNNKLLLIKLLSKLDVSLREKRYITIYHKYQSIAFSQMKDVSEELADAIRQNDYERIANDIVMFNSSGDIGKHFSEQARRTLRIGLDHLMEETEIQAIMLGDNLELERINSIVENLKRIRRAKQFILHYLDTPDRLDKCIADVKKFIEERIKRFLEGVKALININHFSAADRRLDLVTIACRILGNYCTEVTRHEAEELKDRENHIVLKEIVERYSKMDISEYFFNPPIDIFAKFELVINIKPVYNEALKKIKEIIFHKFTEELKQARAKEPPNTENIHVRRFESAVKYLPEMMRNAFEIELKHCTADIMLLVRDRESNSK